MLRQLGSTLLLELGLPWFLLLHEMLETSPSSNIDITAFSLLTVGLPRMMLYNEGQSTMKKSISLVTYAGYVPTIIVRVTMPLGTILSLMKLNRGEVKGLILFLFSFIC